MGAAQIVFWDVDTQRDFMLPGGALYVPDAEKLIPNLERLVGAARKGQVLLISTSDAHTLQDEELRHWPPHCLVGTPGQQKIPETLLPENFPVPNRADAPLPASLEPGCQIIIQKNTLDDFDNPRTEQIVEQLSADAEFVVFGVVTEYCVRLAAKGLLDRGRRVSLVTDAIETLNPADGDRTIRELTASGARLVNTEQALAMVGKAFAARGR